jgi:hypothetical protein
VAHGTHTGQFGNTYRTVARNADGTAASEV